VELARQPLLVVACCDLDRLIELFEEEAVDQQYELLNLQVEAAGEQQNALDVYELWFLPEAAFVLLMLLEDEPNQGSVVMVEDYVDLALFLVVQLEAEVRNEMEAMVGEQVVVVELLFLEVKQPFLVEHSRVVEDLQHRKGLNLEITDDLEHPLEVAFHVEKHQQDFQVEVDLKTEEVWVAKN
jgi:hypothetical protein